MDTDQTTQLMASRAPALDGMRALLVLGVIAFHLWADSEGWKIDPGSVGVVGFFALSGFLITGLLLKEHDTTGRINMGYFYARRALRLLPALVFFLFVWFLVDLIFQHGQFLATVPSAHTPGSPVSWVTGLEGVGAALTYVTNWLNAESAWHLWNGYSPISHLWTLAVEEQFYVLWAPVMLVLLRLRRQSATLIAAGIALLALLDPLLMSSSGFNRVYFGTDTRCAALFCGAVCAFMVNRGTWRFLRTAVWAPALGAVLVALIAWSTYALRQEGHRGTWNTGLIVCTLACSLGVVYLTERPLASASRLLSSKLLVGIGRRSYALYLWSYVLNTWLRDTGFWESFLVIGGSFLAAEISYRLVELPALSFKHHFSTIPVEPAPSEIERMLATATLALV
ncbi:MAG TPA: acyltransferase [Acidimicrobiales bacterium]|jgi:peptidoglycan/LPS O-acetylase OafA/YrhL